MVKREKENTNFYIIFHLCGESEDVKRFIGELHVLLVVDAVNSEFALGHVPVVLYVVGQKALLLNREHVKNGRVDDIHLEIGDCVRHDVVEGVVAALQGLLVGETRLLEKINHHVSS